MTTVVLNKKSIDDLKKVLVKLSVALASPQDTNDESREVYNKISAGAKDIANTFRPYATAILDELAKNLKDKTTLTKEQFVELSHSSSKDAVTRVIARKKSHQPEFIAFLASASNQLLFIIEEAFDTIAEDQGKLPPRGKLSP